jgi:hypothetical protein
LPRVSSPQNVHVPIGTVPLPFCVLVIRHHPPLKEKMKRKGKGKEKRKREREKEKEKGKGKEKREKGKRKEIRVMGR